MKYDIKNLTIDEKITLLTGASAWETDSANGKLKKVFMADGPNGLRMIDPNTNTTRKATAMPTLSSVANTWSRELARLDGETIGDECVERNVSVLLAPGVNIKRTPLNGRNFEYFSEDPYLAGTLAKEYIDGVQSKGVGTSLKHYLANNREFQRQSQSSEIDERTLNEIYLVPFEIALKAKPWTVMCSYNPVNGIYASENQKMLKTVLRDRLGFDGVIVSDWSAVHNSYKSHKATLDLQMPYRKTAFDNIKDAFNKGLISEEEIDFCINDILELIEKTDNGLKKVKWTEKERHDNAVKIAKESIVLLKNQDGILPIKSGTVAVCGSTSLSPIIGGGGSAFVQSAFEQKPLADELNGKNTGAKFVKPVYPYFSEAINLISKSDLGIICVNGYKELEEVDRTDIKLPPMQEKLIIDAAKVNPNIVVCVYAGSAIDMSGWIDKVKGVFFVGYGGEGITEALASVITGESVPSGKLAETFPLSLYDTPTKDELGDDFIEWYKEGIFVGYRHYDKYNKEVLFPFGHGLSYADFEYSDLKVKKLEETDYEVSYYVENKSDFDAKEVSQVYIKDEFCMVMRPEKELKEFSKDLIKAHDKKHITVKLDFRSFAYYSTNYSDWHVENGKFEILVGSSSRDIRLKTTIEINLPDETQQSLTY